MRILLDESLPVELAAELDLPLLKTVSQLGLKGYKNGALLQRAEALSIEVLITARPATAWSTCGRSFPPSGRR